MEIENNRKNIERNYTKLATDIRINNNIDENFIDKLIENNVLDEDIIDIFNYTRKENQNYTSFDYDKLTRILKENNIRAIIDLTNLDDDIFLFLDNFIIIGNKLKEEYIPIVIPYSCIEYFMIKRRDADGHSTSITYTTKGNPTTGAIVGGIVGGATGAVIGATMTSKSQVRTLGGNAYSNSYYTFSIKIKNVSSIEGKIFTIDLLRSNAIHLENRPFMSNLNYVINCRMDNIKQQYSMPIEEADIFCEKLETKINQLIDNAVDFDKRNEVVKYIENITKIKTNLYQYCSNQDFIEKIIKIGGENLPKFKNVINNVSDQITQISQMKQQKKAELTKLQKNYSELGLFKLSEKREIKNKINYINNEIEKYNDYNFPDISKTMYDILIDKDKISKEIIIARKKCAKAIIKELKEERKYDEYGIDYDCEIEIITKLQNGEELSALDIYNNSDKFKNKQYVLHYCSDLLKMQRIKKEIIKGETYFYIDENYKLLDSD